MTNSNWELGGTRSVSRPGMARHNGELELEGNANLTLGIETNTNSNCRETRSVSGAEAGVLARGTRIGIGGNVNCIAGEVLQ